MKADLHIHSEYSFDGEKPVNEIIEQALNKGIDFISICDHNETLGSLELSQSEKIQSISGIEIDCYDGEIVHHILGYGCNLKDYRFQQIKTHYMNELMIATQKRIDVFNSLFKIKLNLSEIAKEYPNKIITNVEMTKYMFKHFDHDAFKPYLIGEKKNNAIANFYWDYCSIDKAAYVPLDLPNTNDIIDLIHDTNGVSIIAHPMIMGVDLSYYDSLKTIDGIEACCSYHDKEQVKKVIQYANNRDILITCGSDYHGINKPNIEIGQHNEPFINSDKWLTKLFDKL